MIISEIRKNGSRREAIMFIDENGEPEVSRTKQSFKDECDINKILARARKNDVIEHVNRAQPHYGDIKPFDLATALMTVKTANDMFAGMSSKVRNEFDNDPVRFLDFVQNPDNKERCIELGLINKSRPAEPLLGTPENPVVTRQAEPPATPPPSV
jgi:phage internal scaffolding protein